MDGLPKNPFLSPYTKGEENIITKLTESELKEKLKGLTIIADSREQQTHVIEYCEKNKVPHIVRKLEVGDYSCMLGDTTFENDIIVERKNSIDELAMCFTSERLRFEREFIRARAYNIKPYLIIENATWSDIFIGNYRSKLSSKSLVSSLLSWAARYNVTILFCRPEETARITYGIFYYYVRERLANG